MCSSTLYRGNGIVKSSLSAVGIFRKMFCINTLRNGVMIGCATKDSCEMLGNSRSAVDSVESLYSWNGCGNSEAKRSIPTA